jgi:hypothetical protein
MKPATDLCSTCQGFTVSLSKTGNLQEEEKELMLQKYGDHLEKAKKQRDYYRDQCQESKVTTGTSVKKAKTILQTYHRIKE